MKLLMLIYRFLSIIVSPLIALFIFFRITQKKEDGARIKERFGFSSQKRPDGDIIWIHAVSIGEVNSALTLVAEILKSFPQISILLTTTTLTSAKILQQKLPQFQGRVIHQFLPIDNYFCVKNFLHFWRLRAAILVESEIWPNLLFEAKKMGVLTFLVNARMSNRSASRWLIAKRAGFKIFDYFSAIFVQSLEDEVRFKKLTSNEIFFYGNLKSQGLELEFDSQKLEILKEQIQLRPVWLAASTHSGEEEVVLKIHQNLKKNFPNLLTIIVLRHPNRSEEVKKIIQNFGVSFVLRSKDEKVSNLTEIYLVDTLNELGIFYRLANFAFIGGSIVDVGGHNPFEAIKLNCAVISGSKVFNFSEIYRNLEQQNACVIAQNAEELENAVRKFLQNDDAAKELCSKASLVINSNENTAKRIVTKVDQILGITNN